MGVAKLMNDPAFPQFENGACFKVLDEQHPRIAFEAFIPRICCGQPRTFGQRLAFQRSGRDRTRFLCGRGSGYGEDGDEHDRTENFMVTGIHDFGEA